MGSGVSGATIAGSAVPTDGPAPAGSELTEEYAPEGLSTAPFAVPPAAGPGPAGPGAPTAPAGWTKPRANP